MTGCFLFARHHIELMAEIMISKSLSFSDKRLMRMSEMSVEKNCPMRNQSIKNPGPNEMKQDCIKEYSKDFSSPFLVELFPVIRIFAYELTFQVNGFDFLSCHFQLHKKLVFSYEIMTQFRKQITLYVADGVYQEVVFVCQSAVLCFCCRLLPRGIIQKTWIG
jgi:hypothetical protein